jgi:hypothetical protein
MLKIGSPGPLTGEPHDNATEDAGERSESFNRLRMTGSGEVFCNRLLLVVNAARKPVHFRYERTHTRRMRVLAECHHSFKCVGCARLILKTGMLSYWSRGSETSRFVCFSNG